MFVSRYCFFEKHSELLHFVLFGGPRCYFLLEVFIFGGKAGDLFVEFRDSGILVGRVIFLINRKKKL
jgi:hypothetical protein